MIQYLYIWSCLFRGNSGVSACINIQKKYIRAEETDYMDKKREGGALSAQVEKQALDGEVGTLPR